MAVMVEIGGAEETASDTEEVGGTAEETGSGPEETGGGAEVAGSKPDITDIRLTGLRILLGISRSEYGWQGFGGHERGWRRGTMGAGRARGERKEKGAARVWAQLNLPAP
jgi:hypothetical protein